MVLDDLRGLGGNIGVPGLRPAYEFLLQFGRDVVHEDCFFFRIAWKRHNDTYLYQNDRNQPPNLLRYVTFSALARTVALGQSDFIIVNMERKTRAIAVQLSPETIKRLDELAEASGMSRHRYMILILERAIKGNVTVREQLAFSNEHP